MHYGHRNRLVPVSGSNVPFPWLWIGTWSLGGHGWGRVNGEESLRTLRSAFEHGIRHFDTAGLYARGESERLLRKAFARNRKEVFISTKGGLHWEGNRVVHDARPETLEAELLSSLERLGTSYADLFQLHWPDPDVPVKESLDALNRLREKGLARFTGAGNLGPDHVENILPHNGLMPHEVKFSPADKSRVDVLLAGRKQNRCLNCITSPLEQGLLGSGAGSRGLQALGKKDNRRRNPVFHNRDILKKTGTFHGLCNSRGCSPVTSTLLWILSHNFADIIIPGPKTCLQLKETLEHAALVADLTAAGNISSINSFSELCRHALFSYAGRMIAEYLDAM